MAKVAKGNHLNQSAFWLILIIEFLLLLSISSREIPPTDNSPPVRLETSHPGIVIVDNGLVQVTFENPTGNLLGIRYKGIDNVFQWRNKPHNRGYWDVVWGDDGVFDEMETEHFNVITQTDDILEISFNRTWTSENWSVPLNVDKRYIIRRGVPGIHAYAILERQENFPSTHMSQLRLVFKLLGDRFHHMALSDTRQTIMPTEQERKNSPTLEMKEASLITNTTNPELKGQVDDKYQFSYENKDNKLHGWIADSENENPAVGFWIITPSNEFRIGGPHKQELTSHVGPTAMVVFASGHYVGKDIDTYFEQGKPWKKVLGPVFIYLNSASTKDSDSHKTLWGDAKRQLRDEIESWPYNFTRSDDFPSAEGRGNVRGQLIVRDRYMETGLIMPAGSAYVGLAPPGEAGSWQRDAKGYQFWTQADEHGRFEINHVRPEDYNLYAWVPGFIGDYRLNLTITIQPGNKIDLGSLIYDPPRNGPTLWEIGIPDRKAAEFFIPDPYPTRMNRICKDPADRYRQYGLWDRYTDLYPDGDLVYTVGKSNYSQDWFFAHVLRRVDNNTRVPTTWQIRFNLDNVQMRGLYTLQLVVASAASSDVQVRFNDPFSHRPHFTTHRIGWDNAIARHGIHGLYRLYSIVVPGFRLRYGENTIFLTQPRNFGTFTGVMYDYIRLEGPAF
ncbi:hypothetical protein COLO4_11705 [Corchorus olitorius]|uniref:rhamnogalacturonan endolyase n=1 Tax=Corchorus olitorius TaxID=93759 RepID=A0A1R3K3J4_9ROSI|nr:hypothetical protein COLO4_11705 [Corchorus olitorius]